MAEQKEAPKIIHTVELSGPKPNLLIQEGLFKDKIPMLHLVYLDGNSKLSFGAGKAKMILHALPQIVAFYEKHKDKLNND